MKKLYKSKKNKIVCGVCGGIGEYFKWDPTIVRLVFAAMVFFSSGAGIIAYIIAALIIPSHDDYDCEEDIENLKSANAEDTYSENQSDKTSYSDKEFNDFFKK